MEGWSKPSSEMTHSPWAATLQPLAQALYVVGAPKYSRNGKCLENWRASVLVSTMCVVSLKLCEGMNSAEISWCVFGLAKWSLMERVTMWTHFIFNMFIIVLCFGSFAFLNFRLLILYLSCCTYWSMPYHLPKGDAKTPGGCSADWES